MLFLTQNWESALTSSKMSSAILQNDAYIMERNSSHRDWDVYASVN